MWIVVGKTDDTFDVFLLSGNTIVKKNIFHLQQT
jgi:hypothetical protein